MFLLAIVFANLCRQAPLVSPAEESEAKDVRRYGAKVYSWINSFLAEMPDIVDLPFHIPIQTGRGVLTPTEVESYLKRNQLGYLWTRVLQAAGVRLEEPDVNIRLPGWKIGSLSDLPRPVLFRNGREPMDSFTRKMSKRSDFGNYSVNDPVQVIEANDIFALAAQEDRARSPMEYIDSPYGYAASFLYSSYALPDNFDKFIRRQFDDVKLLARKMWPGPLARELGQYRLKFDYSSGTAFVCKADDHSKQIFVSPRLMRALLVLAAFRTNLFAMIVSAPAERERDFDSESCLLRFRRYLRFFLAHEAAHIFDGAIGSQGLVLELDESKADIAAATLLERCGETVDIGAFEILLVGAIKDHPGELWGESFIENSDEIKQRLLTLKDLLRNSDAQRGPSHVRWNF